MSARDPASLCGSGRDAFATERSAALPFLPTLLTACIIAALSLWCRPSSESAPTETVVAAVTVQPGADGFHAASDATGATRAVPATVAFGQVYPLNADGIRSIAEAPRSAAATRIASASKRGCGAGRCAEAKRAEPVRAAANPPRQQADPVATSAIPSALRYAPDQIEDPLPEDALPFMPTAASAMDAVRALGGGAASVGGSVLGALALPR